jgi:predicted Zn-dependent protease
MLDYSLYIKWWKTWKSLPVRQWLKASVAYRQGSYELAADLYQKGLIANPNHRAESSAKLDLSYCLFQLGKIDESQQILKNLIYKKEISKMAYRRLIKQQILLGNYIEAAWSARRALQEFKGDAYFESYFIFAVVENPVPSHLLQELKDLCGSNSSSEYESALRMTGQAVYELALGKKERASKIFAQVLLKPHSPFEAYLYYGQMLLKENEIMHARKYLRIAMQIQPNSPKVLALFAETYLKPGIFYRPEFAAQLAISAAQKSFWQNPWILEALATAYHASGDKMSALVIASKAQAICKHVHGFDTQTKSLDRLINYLRSEQVEDLVN